MEVMKIARSACWVLPGLMLAASGGVYAEELQNGRQRAKPAIQQPAGIDTSEKPLQEAEALMKAGKPAEAYELLEPFEFERSGEVRFDYLIGIAALDSGKPDKATLAFERVLAVDPDYTGARMDMARAYYQLGDMPRAKTEFEAVLKQNPTEAARATIQKYLDAIAERIEVKRTRVSGYIEGIAGYDTNVNNASELTDNIITPSPYNAELADNYFGLAAGVEINIRLNANWLFYAGANMNQRNYYSQKSFDMFSTDERAGVIYGTVANSLRVGVLGGQDTMGTARFRDSTGFNGEWRHAVGINNQLNAFAQYRQYRFSEISMRLNDVDQQIAGIGWLHVFGNGNSTLSGSLYYGIENDVGPVTLFNPDGGRTDGAKRFGGFRVGGQTVLGGSTKLFFSGGEQFGEFEEVNPAI